MLLFKLIPNRQKSRVALGSNIDAFLQLLQLAAGGKVALQFRVIE
jgi:hypothetical protein